MRDFASREIPHPAFGYPLPWAHLSKLRFAIGCQAKRRADSELSRTWKVSSERKLPSSAEEGWPRHQANAAKPPLMERTRWCWSRNHSVGQHHSVCAGYGGSAAFLDRAATSPLLRRGAALLPNVLSFGQQCTGGEGAHPSAFTDSPKIFTMRSSCSSVVTNGGANR